MTDAANKSKTKTNKLAALIIALSVLAPQANAQQQVPRATQEAIAASDRLINHLWPVVSKRLRWLGGYSCPIGQAAVRAHADIERQVMITRVTGVDALYLEVNKLTGMIYTATEILEAVNNPPCQPRIRA